ncbi:uncharacterized protein [Bemisia tabaci]|uniref:uncharacterized protein n=1 Tax=Bemisia tabaci TaxID=7038 RepID=UPI0008F9B32D|nr:PREDICTED: uncharacterized protein LOC109031281 [Bemisia tabaci]
MLQFDCRLQLFAAICFVAVLSSVKCDGSDKESAANSPSQTHAEPAQSGAQSQSNGTEPLFLGEIHSEARMMNGSIETLANGSLLVKTVTMDCVDGDCSKRLSQRVLSGEEGPEEIGEIPLLDQPAVNR